MADEGFRVIELSLQGFNCSQILALMALETRGKENAELVRAMSGLLGGLGCGKLCGSLSGGCCVLGLYAGRGAVDEPECGKLPIMLAELTEWFGAEYGCQFGGVDCDDITGKDPGLRLSRCPQLITDTFKKVMDILTFHEYAVDGQGLA